MEFIAGLKRTDYCGNFRLSDAGKEVTVFGWVQRQRNLGSLIFIDLRDRTGLIQLAFDVTDESTAKIILMSLAETVGARLRKDAAKAEVVSVTIKYNDLSKSSHQGELIHATNITNEIHEMSCRLFDELWNGSPIRLLGIQTSHVSKVSDGRQLSLFDNEKSEKLQKLDKAMDNIREKFGTGAVKRASFLEKM